MVRYARRSTYRRKGRRGNRTLSTRRIFNNKGAKAQARQIYALRRSVNRVARMCKPEVKYTSSPVANDRIGLNNIYVGETVSNYKLYEMPLPSIGANDDNRVGNLIRLLPFKLYFSSQYKKVVNSVVTPIATKLLDTSGGVRMIVLQAKSARSDAPTAQTVLQHTPTSEADSIGVLNSPFVNGITASYHILYNKVIFYSENQLIKCKNLSIKPVIKEVQWDARATYPKGHIWVMLIAGGFSYIDVGSGDNPYDYDVCDYALRLKTTYTDA